MKANCGKNHKINYQEVCCLKNLVEMSEIAENQMKFESYSIMLINTIKGLQVKEKNQFEKFSTPFTIKILQIISKYINFLYFSEQYNNVLLLINFALRVIKKRTNDESLEIKKMKFSYLINISSLCSKTGEYNYALRYLRKCSNLITSSVDQAIFYNNVARIFSDKGDFQSAAKYMRTSISSFQKELFQEKQSNTFGELSTELTKKCQLLSLLYFNEGIILQYNNNVKESQSVFRFGFKFSIENLGEYHPFTSKFRSRLINMDIQNILQNVNYKKTNKNNISRLRVKLNEISQSPSDINRKKRPCSYVKSSNRNVDKIKLDEIHEINNKLNLIIEKIGGLPYSDENLLRKEKSASVTRSQERIPEKKQDLITSFNSHISGEETNPFPTKNKTSYSNVLLPSINPSKDQQKNGKFDISSIAKNVASSVSKIPRFHTIRTNNANEDQEKYIDELRDEFEKEEKNNQLQKNGNSKVQKPIDKCTNDLSTKSILQIQNGKNDTVIQSSTKQPLHVTKDSSNEEKNKRSIKGLISSAIGKKEVKKIDNKNKGEKKDNYAEIMLKIDMDGEFNQLKRTLTGVQNENILNYSISCSDENNSDDQTNTKSKSVFTKNTLHNNSRNLDKNEESKILENIPYVINVFEDNGEEKYTFKPYYCTNPSLKKSSSTNKNDEIKMKVNHKDSKSLKDNSYVIESIDFKKYVEENSYMLKKTSLKENQIEILQNSFKTEKQQVFSFITSAGNVPYKIYFHFLSNADEFLTIRAFNQNESICVHEKKIPRRKLKDIIMKISINEMLPLNVFDNFVKRNEQLVEKILCHTTFLNPPSKALNKIEIKLAPKPVGLLFFKKYTFEFLDCKNASIDLIILKKTFLRMFITNDVVKRNHCITIDIFMDEGSFDYIFSLTDDNNFKFNLEQEIKCKSYVIVNKEFEEKILQKTIKRIGEIIKIRNKLSSSFENICEKNVSTLYKLKMTSMLRNIEFWIQTFDENKYVWTTDYYTFHKILVKNNLQYFTKSIQLVKEDFIQIFGYNPNEVWLKLTNKHKIICHYIMMNSIKLGQIVKEIQTDKNNEIILNLIKINPYSLHSHKFVYYKDNKVWTILFEFLYYNRINHFIRIQISDHLTLDTITHILLGFYDEIIHDSLLQFYYVDFTTFKNDKKEIEKALENSGIYLNDYKLLKTCIIQYIEEKIFKKDNYNLNVFSNYESFFNIVKSKKN